MDVDPRSVSAARAAVPAADVRLGDALAAEWVGPFDVVVGNPPFLSQLSSLTTRRGAHRLGGGAYADTAAVFLALAVQLAHPRRGRVALVLPTSVLATRDARAIRAEVADAAGLRWLWWAKGDHVFGAAVDTVVLGLERGAPRDGVQRWVGAAVERAAPLGFADLDGSWGALLVDLAGVPAIDGAATSGRLGDHATATAGFRRHYYGLVPHLREARCHQISQLPQHLVPVVTVGLLDVGRLSWGERPARLGGRRWDAPAIDVTDLDEPLRSWARDRLRPKVLLATQTRVLEAAVDKGGRWLPSVPAISVEPHDPADLWRVGAVLTSPVASAWAATEVFGAGRSVGAVKLSAQQVLDIPWPAGSLDDAAARLRAGDAQGCARATLAAYGLDDRADLLQWWTGTTVSAR
jgi:hypothetical protein